MRREENIRAITESFETTEMMHEEEARRACSLGLGRADDIAVDKLRFVPACVACPGDG